MLFSEPKIPQSYRRRCHRRRVSQFQCSSASRKFLNVAALMLCGVKIRFQCSSASRKFLNSKRSYRSAPVAACFSALQRAENSSINGLMPMWVLRAPKVSVLFSEPKIPQFPVHLNAAQSLRKRFQCSSASRKFLNGVVVAADGDAQSCFSALQRAENSSIILDVCTRRDQAVSVLFSEPKIPQYPCPSHHAGRSASFSALQRAENSSIDSLDSPAMRDALSFSALQRAENSSIPTLAPASIHISDRDDHASSFLSLPGASP